MNGLTDEPQTRRGRESASTDADAAAASGGGRAVSHAALRARAVEDHQAGRLEAAFDAYRACLRVRPADAGLWTNMGALLRRRGEHAAAAACQRRAASLSPDDAAILNNLGNALHDADALEEALAVRREVLARRPGAPDAFAMIAVTLRALGRCAEAAEICLQGLEITPGHAELRVQRAMALLAMGDYAQGFELFEARWEIGEISKSDLGAPEWRGGPPEGRRILVMPEQGFGDTLLMARFLPALKARVGASGEVMLAVKAPLERLFQGLPGVDRLLPVGAKKPALDMVTHMMDLPRLLGADRGDLPPAPPLTIPQEARERARRRAAPFDDRFRIGVCWSGSTTYKANFKRSFGPERFGPLAGMPDVQLFSLYKGPLLEAFRASPWSALIVDAAGDDRDFVDAAAWIEEMDLVVTMDTAVAHLAATLGRPVWNLLASSPFWLYGPEGETTPWHPSMRLFRQPSPGDWDGVVAQVAEALGPLVAQWRETRA